MSLAVDRIALTGAGNGSGPVHSGVPEDAELVVLTLDRPEAMNPIDHDLLRALRAAVATHDAAPSVRAMAITGRGRAFSAGGDMVKYQALQRDPVGFPAFLAELHALLADLAGCRTPVLALVNGVAVAGGIELLLGCDFAVAGASARIGDAHLPYGQMPGGALTLLPRVVGPTRARELVFTGRLLDAEESREWGLVSRVVPDHELLAAGVELARGLARRSPLAVGNSKQLLNAALWDGTTIAAGLRTEREATSRYGLTSTDSQEGLSAFTEKRDPVFTGT